MSLYKNPQTATQLNAPESVNPNRFYGTNFSILGIGGYVEVYSVNDLIYTIPVGSSGPVEISENTIPIYSYSTSYRFIFKIKQCSGTEI